MIDYVNADFFLIFNERDFECYCRFKGYRTMSLRFLGARIGNQYMSNTNMFNFSKFVYVFGKSSVDYLHTYVPKMCQTQVLEEKMKSWSIYMVFFPVSNDEFG